MNQDRPRWALFTDLLKTYGNALVLGGAGSAIVDKSPSWPLIAGAVWLGVAFAAIAVYIVPLGEKP